MNARGFTLVEMLVAMAVFGLLAAAAAGILNVTLRNADVFDRADALTREVQRARTIMRADFAQVANRPVRDAYGAMSPAIFAGGGAADGRALLVFVRHGWENPGGADARGSLQYVEYAIDGNRLMRRTRPYLDPTPDTPVSVTMLLSDVRGAAFSFLSNGSWSDRWVAAAGRGVLPEAVALDVAGSAVSDLRQIFFVGER